MPTLHVRIEVGAARDEHAVGAGVALHAERFGE